MSPDQPDSARRTGGPLPVCFMVMPFRRRKVEGTHREDAPGELDCDALWDKVFRPTLVTLGYLPIRADAEAGSVIVKDMLERLAYAHLVLADVSLPNGNVYYEVGLRQAARDRGCVLVSADWSRQLFDIDQFRSVRYPMPDGHVPDDLAAQARAALEARIPAVAQSLSPWHEFITGTGPDFPYRLGQEQAEAASHLQERMGAVRLAPRAERPDLVNALLADVAPSTLSIPEIASELLMLARDWVGWSAVSEVIERLPDATRRLPFMREQAQLARANTGKPGDAAGAIAALEQIIKEHGETPERHGLIGGRYRRLWSAAQRDREARGGTQPSADERRFLNKAIEHYSRGMDLDLNEYYCSNNLPLLLRARGGPGDADRAAFVDQLVVVECQRALTRGEHDEWLRPTLLGAAFRAGDLAKAQDLAAQVEQEGAAAWQLTSTLDTLRGSLGQTADPQVRAALSAILDQLAGLVDEGG
ncbi:MAG: tetratricopeptide repeat-containing protein [Vicinamibacterales bacterium]